MCSKYSALLKHFFGLFTDFWEIFYKNCPTKQMTDNWPADTQYTTLIEKNLYSNDRLSADSKNYIICAVKGIYRLFDVRLKCYITNHYLRKNDLTREVHQRLWWQLPGQTQHWARGRGLVPQHRHWSRPQPRGVAGGRSEYLARNF